MKNKNKKILVTALTSIISLASFGGGTLLGFTLNNENNIVYDGSGLETGTIQNGISIKNVSTNTLETGEMVKTFTYNVEPANAVNQDIKINISWNKESLSESDFGFNKNVEDYVSFEINNETKTVTVTCKQAFGTQIALNLVSVDNPNAKAIVTCDYRQRIDGIALTKASSSSYTDGIYDLYGGLIYINNEVNSDNHLLNASIQYDCNDKYFYDNFLWYHNNRYEVGSLDYIKNVRESVLVNVFSNDIYTLKDNSFDYTLFTDVDFKLRFNVEALNELTELVLANSDLLDSSAPCYRCLHEILNNGKNKNVTTTWNNLNNNVLARFSGNVIDFEFYEDHFYFNINSVSRIFADFFDAYFTPFQTSIGTFLNSFVDSTYEGTYIDEVMFNGNESQFDYSIDYFFGNYLKNYFNPDGIMLDIITAYYNLMSKIFYCEVSIPTVIDCFTNEPFSFNYYIGYVNPIAELLPNTESVIFN